MARYIYVNGSWLPYRAARIHVEDRGFQFADGVYEALAVRGGQIIDVAPHIARLKRSLDALDMAPAVALRALPHLMAETVRRNYVDEGMVYLQMTRGAAKRDHAFPQSARPSLTIIARHVSIEEKEKRTAGAHIITRADERWRRCDIKSLNLLPNVLARQYAAAHGAGEAWLVNSAGKITEGTASNAWIYKGSALITYRLGREILGGITRAAIMDIAAREGVKIDESGFTLADALGAEGAFISSSIGGIIGVLSIDGQAIAQGALTRRLRAELEARLRRQTAQHTRSAREKKLAQSAILRDP